MGCTAECEVLARKETSVFGGQIPRVGYTYTDYSIIGVPGDLPEGEYTVSFDGFTLSATCHRGYWLPRGRATRDDEAVPLAS